MQESIPVWNQEKQFRAIALKLESVFDIHANVQAYLSFTFLKLLNFYIFKGLNI